MPKFLWVLFIIFPLSLIGSDWSPDFIIAGAQKSGTTVLYELINQHPKIVKNHQEVRFFDIQFHEGIEWYQKQFKARNDPSQLIGEKSPYYLFHPYVPERVHSLYPDVKLIILLRNPIDRAYSQYWMNRRSKSENLPFEEAIEAETTRLAGEEEKLKDPTYQAIPHRKYSYLARGIYVSQIRNWLQYFPQKQMLILSSTDLRNKPKQVANKCFTFLGLTKYTIVLDNPKKQSSYPPMAPETRQKLADYFRPYNQELEKLLDRQFHWN